MTFTAGHIPELDLRGSISKNRVGIRFSATYIWKMNPLLIPKPSLFSFEECLWFLNRNYDDCLHLIEPGKLSKAIVLNGQDIAFTLQSSETHLILNLESGRYTPALKQALQQYIVEWFDLERDIQPFYKLLEKHRKLNYMTRDYAGFRLIGIHDLYEALCWSIIGQQINLPFAYTLKRRLVEQHGTQLEVNRQRLLLFPRPEVLQHISVDELRSLQFSTRKAEYLIHISRLFADGSISKERLRQCSNYQEQVDLLTAIRGIGVWTANYALMKSLKQMQAIPYGDVGLLNALTNHQLISDRKDSASVAQLFKRFKGWESYLVFYLWRSLSHS